MSFPGRITLPHTHAHSKSCSIHTVHNYQDIQESELVNYLAAGRIWNFKTRSNAGLYLFIDNYMNIVLCTYYIVLLNVLIELSVSAIFGLYWYGAGLVSDML